MHRKTMVHVFFYTKAFMLMLFMGCKTNILNKSKFLIYQLHFVSLFYFENINKYKNIVFFTKIKYHFCLFIVSHSLIIYLNITICKSTNIADFQKGGENIGHNYEEDKRVYEVEEIQAILNISRTKVYQFIKKVYKDQRPFKVIKIGNIYRIPKSSFDHWLDEEQ